MKQQNRPLMLLGIWGPLLLLVLVSLFGWLAVRQATTDAGKAIAAKSIGSNEFAAQLAASSAAGQLDEYFRVVKQIAKDKEFLEAFELMLEDGELAAIRSQIDDPNKNGTEENEKLRTLLVNHPARQNLQPFLQRLLDDPENEYPEAASWFVTDRAGDQVAAAFADAKRTNTIGQNYSYRTYYTGFPSDIENEDGPIKYPVESDAAKRPIIAQPHLSASFRSQASGLWKVAFSSPIRDADDNVLGIVAVTVDLGKLVDFEDSSDHYVMLIDDRKDENGDNLGKVLEHPLFSRARHLDADQRLPQELADVRVNLESLSKLKTSMDPLGQTEVGRKLEYDRKFIIAIEEVNKEKAEVGADVSNDDASAATGKKGIYVIALEDYESVMEPSRNLSARLGRLAVLAFLILVSVAIGMWFLVTRIFRESRRRLSGFSDSGTMATYGSSTATATSDAGSTKRSD